VRRRFNLTAPREAKKKVKNIGLLPCCTTFNPKEECREDGMEKPQYSCADLNQEKARCNLTRNGATIPAQKIKLAIQPDTVQR